MKIENHDGFQFSLNDDEYIWKIENQQNQLIISLTEECNLRCKYCIYQDDRYQLVDKVHSMNEDVLIASLEWFLKRSKFSDEIYISFYGGEPLERVDLIKKAVQYVSKRRVSKVNYGITTNGTLLTKETLKFLDENRFLITISIDGPKHIHNRFRVSKSGKDTYNVILKNIRTMMREFPDLYSRVSFNCVSVYPEEIEEIQNFFLNKNVNWINVEITDYFKPYYITATTKESKKNILNLAKQSPLNYYHYYWVLKHFHDRLSPLGFCEPLTKRTYVSCFGYIGLCEKIKENKGKYILGNTLKGTLSHDKALSLRHYAMDKVKCNCAKCWARKFCQVCYINIDDINVNGDFCILNRWRINIDLKILVYLYCLVPGVKEMYENTSYS